MSLIWDIDVENISRVLKGSKPSLKNYCGDKVSWPSLSLKGSKGHRKVNVKLIWDTGAENISVVSKGYNHFLKSYLSDKIVWLQYMDKQMVIIRYLTYDWVQKCYIPNFIILRWSPSSREVEFKKM